MKINKINKNHKWLSFMIIFSVLTLLLFSNIIFSQSTLQSLVQELSSFTSSTVSQCGLVPSVLQANITSIDPWYCPINQQIYNVWNSQLPLALIAVLISFMIAGIIIMMGFALGSSRIRDYGTGELYESIASALIVGIFLYICAVMFGILPGIVTGPINPYATSLNLISQTELNAQQIYTSLFNPVLTASVYTSVKVNVAVLGILQLGSKGSSSSIQSISGPPFSQEITTFFILPASTIGSLLAEGMVVLNAEYYLIIFFAISAIPVFLVPGVIFRAFIPTRRFGGMLIAIAIGFYLIAPMLFSVAYYFTAPQIIQNLSIINSQLNRFGAGTGSQANALGGTSPLVLQLANLRTTMGSLWLMIIFYPIFIMSITYAIITDLANVLGGEVYTMGSRFGIRRFV